MADQTGATPVPIGPGQREQQMRAAAESIAEGRSFGAFDGDRLAGAAVFHDMRQWWCGRAVPMAGVASVKVAPEDRGRGLARRLMTALLDVLDSCRLARVDRGPGVCPGRPGRRVLVADP